MLKPIKYLKNNKENCILKISNLTITKTDIDNLTIEELTSTFSYNINGLNVNISLLTLACMTGSLEIVKMLDVTKFEDNVHQQYLTLVRLNDLGEDIYEYLSKNGFNDSSYLLNESNSKYLKFYDEFTKYNEMKNNYESSFEKDTCFFDIEILKKLKKNDLNKIVGDSTYFRWAVYNGNLEVVKILLDLDVDIYLKIKERRNIFSLIPEKYRDTCGREIILHCLRNKIIIDNDNNKWVMKMISELVSDFQIIN